MPLTLDHDTCYRAVRSRDPRFDGSFVTAVRTTRIYCRPVCPARTPLQRNVEFFAHAAAAEAAGYRSCRRCRPETVPGSRDWDVRADLVSRALRLVDQGVADTGGVAAVARRLHVSERHLHRSFLEEVGAGPLAVARTRRVQLALRLLDETDLPVTEVAFAAGFRSVRQFNAVVRDLYGRPPSALRRERAAPAQSVLALRLRHREPYDAGSTFGWIGARAVRGVEQLDGPTYRRVVRTPGGPTVVELEPRSGHVELRLPAGAPRGLGALVAAARRVLDLDADPLAVADVLGADPLLAPLVAARPGLRVPGAWDGFELAVRAVVGQQVSVASARTMLGRIVDRCGEPLAQPAGALTHAFPDAAAVAAGDLAGVGLTTRRARTLVALAEAVRDGSVVLDGSETSATAVEALRALPGVGSWTASYVALRALGDPDALPDGDLVLRRTFAELAGPALGLNTYAARWRPWRGYAAMHLWAAAGGRGER